MESSSTSSANFTLRFFFLLACTAAEAAEFRVSEVACIDCISKQACSEAFLTPEEGMEVIEVAETSKSRARIALD
jgi:hypothetical protein